MKNIIIVTGGAGFIVSNLIKYFVKKTKFKYYFIPTRPGDRNDSTILNNNAEKILGFNVKKKIKTYIKDFIKKH